MITIVNTLLELLVTGLFTAVFLVIAVRLHLFPVLLVEAMTQAEYDAREQVGEDDE